MKFFLVAFCVQFARWAGGAGGGLARVGGGCFGGGSWWRMVIVHHHYYEINTTPLIKVVHTLRGVEKCCFVCRYIADCQTCMNYFVGRMWMSLADI